MIGAKLFGEITTKLEEGYDGISGQHYKYFFLDQDGETYEFRIYKCPTQPTFVETDEGKIINRFNGKEFDEKQIKRN